MQYNTSAHIKMHSQMRQLKKHLWTNHRAMIRDLLKAKSRTLGVKQSRNKVLPEVIRQLLCGEATALPDMKNSPATIRFLFFFSDAEWNGPSSAGGVVCDKDGVSS